MTPATVAANGNTVTYLYGPDGARLEKLAGANTTLYLGDDIERDPTGAFIGYRTADVKRVGVVLNYLHRDHLASIRAVTDAFGAAYRLDTYKPFGEQVETALNPLTPGREQRLHRPARRPRDRPHLSPCQILRRCSRPLPATGLVGCK